MARMNARLQWMVLTGAYAGLWTFVSLAPFDIEPRSLATLVPAFASPPWFPSPPSDIIANVLLGAPFGGLVAAIFMRAGIGRMSGIALAVLATAAVGTLIEIGQLFVRSRISTPVDVISQCCGAALVASLTSQPLPPALFRARR
jgi:VanZ family protein